MSRIITELQKQGELFNEETLESILKPLISHEGMSDKFYRESRVFYYTRDSKSIRDYSFMETEDAVFKIVKFPNTRNFFNHPWSFGFTKQEEAGEVMWKGAYAGRHGELFAKLRRVVTQEQTQVTAMDKVEFPRTITRTDVFKDCELEEFAEELLQELGDQKEWDSLGGVMGLKTYLMNLTYVARTKSLFRKEVPKEYRLIRQKTGFTLLFNSGLLDKYSNFIVMKADLVKRNSSFLSEPYYAVARLDKVEALTDYGLTQPLPLTKFCDKTERVFPSDKITLSDRQGISHIFGDRVNRLGPELKGYSLELLYKLMETNVSLAIKKNEVDLQHLVPFLNMKWDKISYLMPFYASHLNKEDPLCAIVIGEVKPGVWAPITVLRLEAARSNARLLGKVNASWLISKGDELIENSTS